MSEPRRDARMSADELEAAAWQVHLVHNTDNYALASKRMARFASWFFGKLSTKPQGLELQKVLCGSVTRGL